MVTKGTKKGAKKNPLLEEEEVLNDSEVEETTDETTEDEVDEKPTKKSVDTPTKRDNTVEALNSDIKITKKIIDAEEKVQFMIPLAEGEKPGAVHDCFINGYHVAVKKGVMTFVPRSIAELLANYYKITSEVGQEYRIDNDSKKQDALA